MGLLWVVFGVVVVFMLAIDLGVFNRKAHEVGFREALIWSIVWTVVALLFNGAVFLYMGPERGLEFFTGYVIERSLSFDNLFVFVLIFSYFGVPRLFHHRALFWGVVGALVTRAVFIAAGAALIVRFEWILYIFGAILVYSGWKMLREKDVEVHPDRNIVIRAARKLFPVASEFGGGRFYLRRDRKLFLTPLFLVLITIETTDIVFAVDSIPAVFGVTHDPFIAFTSNIFAILGLRASYFLLESVLKTFKYLSHGLSVVLIFIGLKMLAADIVHIPIGTSLAIVMGVLAVAIAASLIGQRRDRRIARKPK
ncbi:MAG TPA: TerC family protein [Bacteroidota bacterium]|nr:TerC family protein [Bacteroidota bacterium]